LLYVLRIACGLFRNEMAAKQKNAGASAGVQGITGAL
jgi:hypothetical protein